ncbi:glucuronate isomerase [Defluviitalea phaphyphila]|uniref:glucuronate isomerase n=1 Tax=Defluviitalea phaphyphila TaxID=1473580 RepID=UPI000730266A|nr:glucuronate isomerase [Defluviitalea phaphyphila]
MKKFLDENFMLQNETAVKLYHNYAKKMPIYDYHCHINPKEIWENKQFKNITEIWLYGDHYKWRAMRFNGIDEEYITGNASDYEKFKAWAKTIPYTIGNPLYHWTHLELQRFFGIYDLLSEKTVDKIWKETNEKLSQENFRVRDLIKRANVAYICTTDDAIDDLKYHKLIREEGKIKTKVLPTLRPDKGVNIEKDTFAEWVKKLGKICNRNINNYDEFLLALEERIKFFHEEGCRLSDHSLEYVPYREASKEEISKIFIKRLKGEKITLEEEEKYKTAIMKFFGRKFAKLGWTMQLHIGAMRNNNTRMFKRLGADAGFDSINDLSIAYPLSRFLDSLDKKNSLPKTILYTLNPKDNYVLAAMLGNFQGDGIPGKIQFGSAWWFNDQRDGMEEQMKALANLGLLSRFIGMLTDSRSFLSYSRHEYFRRILCNLIGSWVENGEFPNDMNLLGEIVQNISFNNAKKYFNM